MKTAAAHKKSPRRIAGGNRDCIMKRFILVLFTLVMIVSLSSCTMLYTDEEIAEIYRQGYEDGVEEGSVEGASCLEDYIFDASSYYLMLKSLQEAREKLGSLYISSDGFDDAIGLLDDALYYAAEFEHEVKLYVP